MPQGHRIFSFDITTWACSSLTKSSISDLHFFSMLSCYDKIAEWPSISWWEFKVNDERYIHGQSPFKPFQSVLLTTGGLVVLVLWRQPQIPFTGRLFQKFRNKNQNVQVLKVESEVFKSDCNELREWFLKYGFQSISKYECQMNETILWQGLSNGESPILGLSFTRRKLSLWLLLICITTHSHVFLAATSTRQNLTRLWNQSNFWFLRAIFFIGGKPKNLELLFENSFINIANSGAQSQSRNALEFYGVVGG